LCIFVLLLKTIPFKFNKISRISSRTPGIVENSWVTPAIRTAEIATPPKSPKVLVLIDFQLLFLVRV
jgi:hypothetical protein